MISLKKARIIGSGLIGTSIGLALSARSWEVEMVDADESRRALAQDLMGISSTGEAALVILALPTSALPLVINEEFALNPQAAFIDVGSTKAKPQAEIESIPGLISRFCGTHPMAGREIGGPESARADLFEGRPWIFTPSDKTESEVITLVKSVIELLGATAVQMSVSDHDSAVALISHLPQISASLLASQIVDAKPEWMSLSGQGLRDSTRIAQSDPKLWREIISTNREEIRPLLARLVQDYSELLANFDDDIAVEAVIERGGEGRKSIPGKHGGRAREYAYVPIVIEDKPGQLGALFHECAQVGVNVEDLTIEHSPGQFTGLVTLALSRPDAEKLVDHLRNAGWMVHSLR